MSQDNKNHQRALALSRPHADLPSAADWSVPLTQGRVALVGESDYMRVASFRWFAIRDPKNGRFYAGRNVRREDGTRSMQQMHRFIIGAPPGTLVDHINGDGLDNRRSNLRLVSHEENAWNTRMHSNNRSGYRGVSRFSASRWVAKACLHGRFMHLGLFTSAEDAARAYDAFVSSHRGRLAVLNFPPSNGAGS